MWLTLLTASVLGLVDSVDCQCARPDQLPVECQCTRLGQFCTYFSILTRYNRVSSVTYPSSLPPSLPHSSSPPLLSFLPPFLPFLLPLLLLPTNVVGLFVCYVSSTLSQVCYSLCLMLSQCCWYVHLCKWLLRSVFYHFTYNSVMISQVRLKFQPRVPFLLREYPINLNPVTLHSFIHIILYSIPSVLVTHKVEKTLLCLSHRYQTGQFVSIGTLILINVLITLLDFSIVALLRRHR